MDFWIVLGGVGTGDPGITDEKIISKLESPLTPTVHLRELTAF